MDLTPYVDRVHHELMVAAESGGEEARLLAERLAGPLESGIRLAVLEALSAAANEITRELAPGSVDVRLRGLDPEFVVTPPPAPESHEEIDERVGSVASGAPPATGETDEGGTARMTLRLPEQVKLRIEEAAGREALPVNTWLVRTITAAMEPGDRGRSTRRRGATGEGHYSGWVH